MSLTFAEIKQIVAGAEPPCVSLYMPTHRTGRDVNQGPIRFKNLLREAEEGLKARGLPARELKGLLEPGWKLEQDSRFWQHQDLGLGVLLSPKGPHHYRVPLSLSEQVRIGERFHLKPLLPLLNGDGRFYIVAVSQKSVRLYVATRDTVEEVELPPDIPRNLGDAVGHDWEQRSLQFHTGSPPGGGAGRAGVFHGHGRAGDDAVAKLEITEFLNQVDRGVRRALKNAKDPLVVAAVDYLIPIYREVSEYPNVLEAGVAGAPDESGPDKLREEAWKIVSPLFRAAQEKARDRFQELEGTGLASVDLEVVLPAAVDGRVESLFVAVDRDLFGRFDASSRRIELSDVAVDRGEDLLDRAALECLLNRGAVYAATQKEVPGGAALAAVFRY